MTLNSGEPTGPGNRAMDFVNSYDLNLTRKFYSLQALFAWSGCRTKIFQMMLKGL